MRPAGLSLTDVLAYFGVPTTTASTGCVAPRNITRTQKNGYWAVRWGDRSENLHRLALIHELGDLPVEVQVRHVNSIRSGKRRRFLDTDPSIYRTLQRAT